MPSACWSRPGILLLGQTPRLKARAPAACWSWCLLGAGRWPSGGWPGVLGTHVSWRLSIIPICSFPSSSGPRFASVTRGASLITFTVAAAPCGARYRAGARSWGEQLADPVRVAWYLAVVAVPGWSSRRPYVGSVPRPRGRCRRARSGCAAPWTRRGWGPGCGRSSATR